jgi:hypothetical protein
MMRKNAVKAVESFNYQVMNLGVGELLNETYHMEYCQPFSAQVLT